MSGTKSAAVRALECFRESLPLFVFRGTGGAADGMGALIEHTKYGTEQPPVGSPRTSPRTSQDTSRVSFSPQEREWNEAKHLKAFQRLKENICIENPILKFLNNAAVSFPKNWGEASTLSFDVSKKREEAMEETQMHVTQVMSTMYYHIPLLGHHTAELHAVQFAAGLCTILHKASIWYRRQATVLQVIIRVLILTACTVSLITPRPAAVGDGEDQPKDIFSTLNILLPIGVAVMTSVFGLYKPMDKFVATFTAEKLIESEIYRYCTRTGIYKPNRIQCRHHREQFARQCEKIWQDLSVSGAVVGVKCLGGQRVSDLKQGSKRNVIHVEPPLSFLSLEHRETPTRTSPEPHDHENNINDIENAEGGAPGNAKEPARDTTTEQKLGDTKEHKPYKPDIPLLGSKYLENRIEHELKASKENSPNTPLSIVPFNLWWWPSQPRGG